MHRFFSRKRTEEKHEPAAVAGPTVFCSTLDEAIKLSDTPLPAIVEQCIHYIIEHGLDLEGIFRISGSFKMIQELKLVFNAEPNHPNAVETMADDAHTAAGLLKLYIREMSEPAFPFNVYEAVVGAFVDGERSSEDRIKVLKNVVSTLPDSNYLLLYRLFDLCLEIMKHDNKMGSSNLALVLGQNLLRPEEEDEQDMLMYSNAVSLAVQVCLDHFDEVFSKRVDDDDHEENHHEETHREGRPGKPSPLELPSDPIIQIEQPVQNSWQTEEREVMGGLVHDAVDALFAASIDASSTPPTQWSPGDPFPTPLPSPAYAMQLLTPHTRNDIIAEKTRTKKYLKDWTAAFRQQHGHEASVEDKSVIKDVFIWHGVLRQMMHEQVSMKDERMKGLMEEKKRLQVKLYRFQQDFEAENGRAVTTLEDQLPVRADYLKYKEIKKEIAALQ